MKYTKAQIKEWEDLARKAGEAEEYTNQVLSEAFNLFCEENGIPTETEWTEENEEDLYCLRIAFEAGYGICMHSGMGENAQELVKSIELVDLIVKDIQAQNMDRHYYYTQDELEATKRLLLLAKKYVAIEKDRRTWSEYNIITPQQ
jgi:hypothetical protein